MKLSAPIYHLKRRARTISRDERIALHVALDRVAIAEGYGGWSHLASQYAHASPAVKLYGRLRPGDLILIGARPGQGKTLLSLELAVEAMKAGHRSVFFTLEYTDQDCQERLQSLGTFVAELGSRFEFDGSDSICAAHIIEKLESAPSGTLAIVDYLQLLDQKRETPPLVEQVRSLRNFAKQRGLILVFVSQIDRSFDASAKAIPDMGDIRLPNPLDLTLFDKACFLNNGEIHFQ